MQSLMNWHKKIIKKLIQLKCKNIRKPILLENNIKKLRQNKNKKNKKIKWVLINKIFKLNNFWNLM